MTAPTTTKPPVDVSALQDKIAMLAKAQEQIRKLNANLAEWKKHKEALQGAIAAVLGASTSGHIDGREVVTYVPRDQFAHAQFTQDHPDLAQVFMRPQTTMVLDWQSLLAVEPEVAGQYQTRIMKVAD